MKKWQKLCLSLVLLLALAACSSQSNGEATSTTSNSDVATSSSSNGDSNDNQTISSKNTLVILSHPNLEGSTFTRGLGEAASQVEGVTIRHLDELYGTDTAAIDGQEEAQLMQNADRVVFIFPTYWFNITPMMKAYLDEVWGGVGPNLWQGKEMLVVSRAGGGESVYGEDGSVGIPLEDIFVPMEASARYAGMTYLEPLVFEGGSSSDLQSYQDQLIRRLQE